MSRCFPFPPPGYERKQVPEDLDALKEAKRKEKKHKKEKEKEKERKEEKEKGKDKTDEKHKDKKDRKKHKDKKEKHKDKKSKEDRSKDKEKSSISEESTVSGVKLEDKLHPEGHSKDKSHVVDERKQSAMFQGQNGQKPSQSSISSRGNNVTKLVQELDRRIRDDGARGSQLPSLVDGRDQRVAAKAAVGNSSALPANEKVIGKSSQLPSFVDDGDQRFAAKAAVGNSSALPANEKVIGKSSQLPSLVDDRDQRFVTKAAVGNSSVLPANEKVIGKIKRVDDMQKIGNLSNGKAGIEVDRNVAPDGKKNVGGEVKEKKRGDAMVGEKRKDRDKKSRGKDKDKEKNKREKNEKKEKKEKVKSEIKKSKEVKLGEIGGNTFVSVSSGNKITGPSKEVDNIGEFHEVNLRKRKEMCINGFGHEMEETTNKIQRHAPSQQSVDIGKKMEACRTPTKSYDEHTVPNSVSTDRKNGLVNGIFKGKESFPSVLQNSSAVISQKEPVASLPKIPESKKPFPYVLQTPSAVISQEPVPALPVIPEDKKPFPSVLQNSCAVISQEPVSSFPKIPEDKKLFPYVLQNSTAGISQEPVSAIPKKPKSKSISLKAKPTVPTIEDLIAEALKRPPHPDSKHLSKVLTVPSVAGLSDNEDHDWLLTKEDSLDKPKDQSIRLDKEPRVWSEAVRIESADVCALPFVIPY